MKDSNKCPRCKSTNIERGHQELFPSTFISEDKSKFPILNVLLRSKEFVLYACMNCGYSEWYIHEKYLNKGSKASGLATPSVQAEGGVKSESF